MTTTYSYDELHRLVHRDYDDGTPSSRFEYDKALVRGTALQNPIGRLTFAYTDNTGTTFSYDIMGRVADIARGVDIVLTVNRRDDGLFEFRMVKTRHEEICLAIRPDFASRSFEVTESAHGSARRDRESELLNLIAVQPGINTRSILREMKSSGASKVEVLEMLRAGTGSSWRVADGPRRARLYYPLVQPFQCSGTVPEHMSECSSASTPLGVEHRTLTEHCRRTECD